MKIIALFVIALFVIAAVPVTLVGWYALSETSVTEYATYGEAKADGAVGRGWIPDFLPPSAYSIVETHSVDVAAVDVKFRFSPGDLNSIEDACTEINSGDDVRTFRCLNNGFPVIIEASEEGFVRAYSEDAA